MLGLLPLQRLLRERARGGRGVLALPLLAQGRDLGLPTVPDLTVGAEVAMAAVLAVLAAATLVEPGAGLALAGAVER